MRKSAQNEGTAWHDHFLDLQRTAGNAAVSDLLVQRESHPVLRRGSGGAAVRELQEALNSSGAAKPPLAADGAFGPGTDAAVRRYQKAQGLVADGVVGPKTWAAIGGGGKVSGDGAGASNPKVAAVGAKLAQIKGLLEKASPAVATVASKAEAVDAGEALDTTEPLERGAPAPAHDMWDDATDWLGETAGEVVDTVTETAGEVVDTVSDAAGDAADWVGETAGDAADWVGETAGDAADWVGETAGDAADWAAETAGEVVTGLQEAASDVADTIGEMGEQIGEAFQEQWDKLKEIAAAIASGLGLDEILNWLEEVYGAIEKKVSSLLDDEGGEAGEGDDVHGTLPGVHYGGLATSCDATEGKITYTSDSKRGKVEFGKGDFGLNQPVIDVNGDYTIFRGRDGVGIDARVKLENRWEVQSAGNKPITSADDPAIGPSNWDKVANDLDPALGEGYPGSPPRTEYWVEAFTVAHEQFHERENVDWMAKEVVSDDVKRLVDKRFVEVSNLWRFERWLGLDPGEEENVRKKLNGFLDDIGKHLSKGLEKATTGYQAESRAYRAGRGDYEKLVAAIRARGQKNGWPKNV